MMPPTLLVNGRQPTPGTQALPAPRRRTSERGSLPTAPEPSPAAAPLAREIPPDAWDLARAARFLGMSTRTLERYVAKRRVPCIVYESPTEGDRPLIRFNPRELAAWRQEREVARVRRVG